LRLLPLDVAAIQEKDEVIEDGRIGLRPTLAQLCSIHRQGAADLSRKNDSSTCRFALDLTMTAEKAA
jgi:hypothetical protein